MIWWLSFSGADGWLGGCYVRADTVTEALTRTHALRTLPDGRLVSLVPMTYGKWRITVGAGLSVDNGW